MAHKNMREKIVSAFSIVILFMLSVTLLAGTTNNFESIKKGITKLFAVNQDGTPVRNKTLTPYGNGTYKISLDVTGDSEKVVPKANVVVIMDVSGSMNTSTGNGEIIYTVTTSNSGEQYGIVDGEYVRIYRRNNAWRLTNTNYGTQYNGTRYTRQDTSQNRLEAAQGAVNDLAEALFAHNGTNGSPNNTIEMALVSFSNTASVVNFSGNTTKTNSYTTFSNSVNGLEADGGTNWEDALLKANTVNFNDTDPTYVIFVSDGNPTFRNTQGNYDPMDNYYYNTYGVYGNGSDSQPVNGMAPSVTIGRCYDHAVDEAQAIVNANKTFYTIGAYGDVSRMEGLTTDAGASAENYYAASDTAALQNALNEILEKIETAGFSDIDINDGTTESVTTSTGTMNMLTIDEESYEYYISFPITDGKVMINNQEGTVTTNNGVSTLTWGENKTLTGKVEGGKFVYQWIEANDLYDYAPPAAENKNSNVEWNLKKLGVLINNATYTVTFDVWPSQETYDLISDLDNGIKTYNSLDQSIKDVLKPSGDSYTLKTNTNATLKYTDTRNHDGEQTVGYTNPDPVDTDVSEMTVKKLWNNNLDSHQAKDVTLRVLKDNNKYGDDITLSGPSWNDKVYISTGLLTVTYNSDNEPISARIREHGHDYTFQEIEDESYYWDLVVETVRPMLINGTLTTLVKVEENAPTVGESNVLVKDGVTYYKIDGNVYFVREQNSAVMNATNYRRSNLNLKKVVTGEAPVDSEFTFNLSVNDFNNDDVWFSIMDGNTFIKDEDIVTGATKEIIDNNFTGYYYAPSGTQITVRMKANWNLRFTNIPTGSTYSFEETSMPEGFVFDESDGTKVTIVANLLPENAVLNEDGTYTYNGVVYTPVYNSEGNITHYTYEGDVTKTNKKIEGTIYVGNTSYQVTYTNEYQLTNFEVTKVWDDENDLAGFRLDELKVTLYGDGKVVKIDGNDAIATLNENNSWHASWQKLPKFNESQEEIKYTVLEEAVNDKYETSYEGTLSIDVKAKPIDNDDSYVVELYKNGEATGKTVTLNKDNGFVDTVEGLEYLDENGNVYTYTTVVNGDKNPTIKLYSSNKQVTITNSYEPEKINVSVEKVWNDADNQDGIRPEDITVELLADGETTGKTTTLSETNEWTDTFTELDKYADGEEIVYSVKEVSVEGYETEVADIVDGKIVVTNTHTPELTEVVVEKVWNDADNQDGIRPEDITVELLADGETTGKTTTLSETNEWTDTFTELDKYADGEEIVYSVKEVSVEGYETEVADIVDGKITVTNTHTPETREITVKKNWVDNNNQDGIRPGSIKVTLFNGDTVVGEAELNEENGWTKVFTDVPKFEGGAVIKYTADEEEVPEGYVKVVGDMTEAGEIEITNTHETAKISVTVEKVWEDANNQDGIRPENVVVQLYANGNAYGEEVTLDESNRWTYTYTDLDKKESGVDIVYTITEKEVEGYTTDITDLTNGKITVTNTHTPELTEVVVEKVWNDADNQDGIRPEDITVELLANGETTGKTTTLSETNEWTDTFTELDKYADGEEIVYSVKEVSVEGYETEVADIVDGKITVTNTHTPELTEVVVEKIWNDADNQDGIRPEDITVELLANGETTGKTTTLSETNEWTDTFTELDKYADGEEIVYSVKEVSVEGYETEVADIVDGKIVVTNTHTPELTEVVVEKVWNDADNQDGIRPEDITVELLADGETTGKTTTLSETNEWTDTFTELDKYADGEEIVYSVKEVSVEGYETEVADIVDGKIVVTNTHTPETREITVKKNWVDNNNQDGIRPGSIQVTLYNGETVVGEAELNEGNGWTKVFTDVPKFEGGAVIKYTADENEVPEGYVKVVGEMTEAGEIEITNTHETEKISVTVKKVWEDANNQDGIRPENVTVQLKANGVEYGEEVTLDESNGWSYTYRDLDKKESGSDIVYTITEKAVEGYETDITDLTNGVITVTNTHTPELTEVSVEKVWEDANNQDGIRPENITVELLANGETTKKEVVLSETNKWTYTFTELDKYAEGEEIVYSVEEVSVEGYETEVADIVDGKIVVTNTHTPELTEVSGTKTWNDADNQDGKRPESITIRLFADGVEVDSKTVTESDNWSYTFEELPKFSAGKEIEYAITEDEVANYTGKVDGFDVINTHIPSKKNITIEKVWIDTDNQDGKRPQSITVRLHADGEEVDSATVTGDMNKNNWTYTFEDLPEYKAGKLIEYTVTEDTVTDYETEVDGFTIKNTHENEKVTVSGTKTWNDADNQDGIRPESITVILKRTVGDTILDPIEKEVTANDNWSYEFKDLDKYKGGVEIVYTIDEKAVEGYTTEINNYDITNTHKPAEIEISGTKTWDDADNQDGKRPESITINLLADGENAGSKTITEADDWAFTFTELPKFKAGKEIVYTLEEVTVEGYTSVIDNYDITNTHVPETISFNVTKVWDDADNQDGKRPESITVRLLANGEEVKTYTITSENDWTYSFVDLPRYQNGVEIDYTITEDEVTGYTITIGENVEVIDENETKVINNTITNTHEPEKIKIEGEKTWEDFENKYDSRPKEITIYLYKKDELYKTIIVTSETDWKYVIDNLDKYANGEEITYTIREENVEGYETTYNGYNITNTIIWNEGDGELPPQTGFEVSFNNVLYVIISGVLFILGTCLKPEELK